MSPGELTHVEGMLARFLGADEARSVMRQAAEAALLVSAEEYTPQEILRMADALCARGGFIEMMGRSLKVKAILEGAIVSPKRP